MYLKIVVFVATFVVTSSARKLPSFITPCNRNHQNMSRCWLEVLEQMRPHMRNGIPEMGIPPCEPFHIPRLELTQPEGASVGFSAVLRNLSFGGGLGFQIPKMEIDIHEGRYYVELHFPRLTMAGSYKAIGKVLLITFEGDGEITGDFKNCTLYASYRTNMITKNGKKHFHITERTANVVIDSIQIYLDNLFKNNPAITENTNRLINENTELLYSEVKPIIEQTVSGLVTNILASVISRFSIDELYPST